MKPNSALEGFVCYVGAYLSLVFSRGLTLDQYSLFEHNL